jgi:hypothetical protein
MMAEKRKLVVFLLSLTFAVVTSSRAQDLPPAPDQEQAPAAQDFHIETHFGIKGGANIFQVNGSGFANGVQPGFDAGVFAEINFIPQLGIQPELLFNQTNFKTGKYFSNLYTDGVNNQKGALNYISIPLLFTYTPVKWLSLQLGPQLSVLLNDNKAPLQNTQTVFRNGDFSWVMGTQINAKRLKLGLRYVVGLTNLNGMSTKSVTELAEWSNSGAQLYVGYRIF